MATTITTGKKIIIKGSLADFSFKQVDLTATAEQLYELADAISSLQDGVPKKIVMVVEKAIF